MNPDLSRQLRCRHVVKLNKLSKALNQRIHFFKFFFLSAFTCHPLILSSLSKSSGAVMPRTPTARHIWRHSFTKRDPKTQFLREGFKVIREPSRTDG